MYNTILVTTDFSHPELTIQSLKKAKKLSDKGQIVLLHVLDVIPDHVLVELPAGAMQNMIPQARQKLTDLVEKSGVKADIKVRKGSSYRNIIAAAKETNADLILINSHRPELKDYLLGSTAAKVVRHASCSVLIER